MGDRAVAVVCGGVGAARFLRGLERVLAAEHITAVVNVADDVNLHGLHVSPDLDTVVYTLAGEIDPERGWGLRDETWNAMEMLSRYGDGDWFSLGDRDLGTHLHRTHRLHEGASLTTVTAEIAAALGVGIRVLPVSDDRISTRVTLAADGQEIGFQDYFVGHGHEVEIAGVRFVGIDSARASAETVDAIAAADVVIIAPSNPIVSIGPVLAVPGVTEALRRHDGVVVAVSPIVGGAALKGPAARMMTELGHDASAVGVAAQYAEIVDLLVIDQIDAALAPAVAATGVTPVVTDTIMSDPARAAALARTALAAAALGVRGRTDG